MIFFTLFDFYDGKVYDNGLSHNSSYEGCLAPVGKDIELDAVDRQFEPYSYRKMRLHAGGALVV